MCRCVRKDVCAGVCVPVNGGLSSSRFLLNSLDSRRARTCRELRVVESMKPALYQLLFAIANQCNRKIIACSFCCAITSTYWRNRTTKMTERFQSFHHFLISEIIWKFLHPVSTQINK